MGEINKKDLYVDFEHKLTVLFFLNQFESSVSRNEIIKFFTDNEILSYIFLHSAITDMLASSFIEEISDTLTITEEGEFVLSQYEKNIPMSVRTSILKHAKDSIVSYERDNEVITHSFFEADTNTWTVKCSICDSDFLLLEVNLSVFSHDEAMKIEKNWKKKYKEIYNLLIDDLTAEEKDEDKFLVDSITEEDKTELLNIKLSNLT